YTQSNPSRLNEISYKAEFGWGFYRLPAQYTTMCAIVDEVFGVKKSRARASHNPRPFGPACPHPTRPLAPAGETCAGWIMHKFAESFNPYSCFFIHAQNRL